MAKKTLSTTNRGSSIKLMAPGEEAIRAAAECVKFSREGADYLVSAFANQMKKLGKFMMNCSKGMLQNLEEFRDKVYLHTEPKDNPWKGEFSENIFKNTQVNIADNASKDLIDKIKEVIKIDFAISSSSEFIRGFTAAGKKLAEEIANALDKLINTFFASKNIVTKGSVLYEATEDGTIKNEDGKPKKVDPPKAEKLIKEELVPYLKAHGLSSTVKKHTHPADAKPPAADATLASKKRNAPT